MDLSHTRTGNPHMDRKRFVVAKEHHESPGQTDYLRFETEEEAQGYTRRAIEQGRFRAVAYLGEDS